MQLHYLKLINFLKSPDESCFLSAYGSQFLMAFASFSISYKIFFNLRSFFFITTHNYTRKIFLLFYLFSFVNAQFISDVFADFCCLIKNCRIFFVLNCHIFLFFHPCGLIDYLFYNRLHGTALIFVLVNNL